MGKKADKWKAKYNGLMHITESYIRHLHEANSRLSHYESGARGATPEPRWGDDCCDPFGDAGCDEDSERVKELEARVDEVENELLCKDRELAEEIEAREAREAEFEETVSRLDDEKSRLEYRVDDLEQALRDLITGAEDARVLRASLEGLESDQRVHLFEREWDDLIETAREAREVLDDVKEQP